MKNKNNSTCPVCGQGKLEGEFDICKVCFWENDKYQLDNPDEYGGANNLSLNDYKKWWNSLETILPISMKKFNVKLGGRACWKYDDMIVPRKNISDFINEMTKHNIELRASFYFMCDKYHLDDYTFVGYPLIEAKTANENNEEIIRIIFSNDPISICKKYKMPQVLEVLQTSNEVIKTWEQLTPHICIMPNPTFLPKM